MKQFFYTRKSKLLLFMLLAFFAGGVSPTWAQKTLPYSYGFEDENLATDGWTSINNSSANASEFGIKGTTGIPRTGKMGFQFSSYTKAGDDVYDQYLVSPEISAPNGVVLSFYYKASSTSTSGEKFKVGYSKTDDNVENFTWGDEYAPKTMTWTEFTNSFPEGTKYIAIHYYPTYQYRLYVDDFSFTAVDPYPAPSDFISTGYTSTTATFSWTNGGEETAWQIAYSTTQGFDAGSVTPVDVTTKPYTLEGLTAETTYYARIRANYGGGNYSNWSDEISFKPSAAINTIVNNGSATNGYIPFYGSYADTDGTMSQFIIPSTSLTEVQNRQITKLTFYGTASLNFGTAKFKVYMKETDATSFANTTFDWTSMDEVANASVSTDSEGKMVIELESPFDYSDGNLMIGFKISATGSWKATTWTGVSSGSAIYAYDGSNYSASFLPKMTITSLPLSSAPKKPKNFDDSATTTTTATLGWTNGSDETAWQIAYSTDTDFDPDTEGTKVAVDANPYTLTGLTAGTTYYAYIRAKKAEEYSDWSNKADFTTLSAAPVIELSATSHNFGIVSDADTQALTLTITNSGGAALTGLAVTPSAGFAVTDADGNALTTTTIAASANLVVKVKVNAVGQQNGTVTVSGTGIDNQTVNVSGYMLDDTKICETFASKPNRWIGDWYSYSAANGAYSGTSAHTLTTPKISVSEGNILAIRAKYSYNGGYLTIEGSSDNGSTWTAYSKTINYNSDPNLTNDFKLFTFDDVPTTVNKLRLTGYYVYINVFNGFTYVNDPILGIFSNEACTTAQSSPSTKNFGFATEAQNQLYYIKNTGNGQIDLTIEQADGFTAVVDDAALTEGEKATLNITMPATEGLHEGTITVTAKNHDNNVVLGTFVVNANGAITGSKNNVVLTSFPAGWQNNNWAINSGAARIWSGTASDLITTTLRVTAGDKLLVEAKKYYNTDDSQLSYSYSADGGTNWSDPVSLTSSLSTDYEIVAITGIPAGDVLMKFTGTYAYIRQIYGFEAVAEPIMEFAAEGTTKNFGMITAKITSDAYTITNSGTAALNGLSVTCDNSNFEIAVAENATSIAAGESVTFTVALKTTALGSQSGTVTIAGTDVESKTFTVKGYVADDSKVYETFASLPSRWTEYNYSSYYSDYNWSYSAINGAYNTNSNSTLTTPKISIAENEVLTLSIKLGSGSGYLTIEGSSDNGSTWTAFDAKTYSSTQGLNTSDFSFITIEGISTSVNKLRIKSYYAYINGLNGFTYDDNDPEFSMFSDSECNTAIATATVTNNWGFVSEDKTVTYYIKNTGTGTLTLSKSDAPAGFTATLAKNSLTAGESTSLTVAMAYDAENNEGYHAGDVVLTAKNSNNDELGTFTVTSSGVVAGAKADINFATLDAFPAGWEATNWSVTSGVAKANSYTAGSLTTGTYSVTAGEALVIEAKGNNSSSYYTPSLTYQYSVDGGEWTTGTSVLTYAYSASDYQLQAITDIPVAGDVMIKFTGSYIDIRRMYGYTVVAKPVMALDKTADYDFGMQTEAADYVITVTNTGTANLTNLAATLTTGEDYSVVVSKTTLAPTETATVTVTQLYDAAKGLASLSDELTISADGVVSKTINLNGKTRDASKWFVDFASEIPSSFVEDGSWTVTSGKAYLSSSTESKLITQPISVAAGEKMYFDAANPYSGSLKVRYSLNGGISWSDYTDYSSAISTSSSSLSTHEISLGNSEAVTAIVEFCGRYYVYLDNIYGGTLNDEAPMIAVTKSAAAVENGTAEAFGSIKSQATATYTITNVGNGTLTITSSVATTGVATATVNATSLGNGESATLTITMPVEAPYGEKSGAVTVKTTLGDFVINYTATTLNPNALDEQFASGKPAGWYFGGYWEVSSNAAQNNTSSEADLITEQVSVTGESDVLTFQAARTSSTNSFAVYTSTDRLNWTEINTGITLTNAYQDVTISGLTAGDYYLKITGKRVKVDNFLGWTKKNNSHDLYVTATSIPSGAQTLGAKLNLSATVTSLIANETDVYAKLFIDDVETATADAQDIDKDATKTFAFEYTMPSVPASKEAKIVIYYSDETVAFTTATTTLTTDYETLDISEALTPTITAGTYNVKLDHDFVVGWNTVCLPFTINVADIHASAVAFSFDGYDTTTKELTFNKVTTLEARKPYVIYVPEEITADYNFKAVEITDVNTTAGESSSYGVTFQGTYAPMAAGSLTDCCGLTASGKIAKAKSTTTMKGFRGYFMNVPAGARVMFNGFEDDETTGIRMITIDNTAAEGTYNMQGQKVEQLKKGRLYIINGKKQVVK